MSHETGKTKVDKDTSSQDIPDIADLCKDFLNDYEDCITTTIYGDSYLDPEKCKAKGLDPIKAAEDTWEKISLSMELVEKRTKERNAQFEEYFSKGTSQFNEEDPNFGFAINENSKEQNIDEKIRSLMVEASYLMNRKIKLVNGSYVKVVAVIMNAEEVLLGVEEGIRSILDYYEISYEESLIDFKAKVMRPKVGYFM